MSPTGTRTSKSADSLDGKTEGITPRITRRHFPNTSFPSSPLPAAAPASHPPRRSLQLHRSPVPFPPHASLSHNQLGRPAQRGRREPERKHYTEPGA